MKPLLALLVFVGACVSSQKTLPAELRNTHWVLRELNGAPVPVPEGGREAFILFAPDDTKVSGMGSCNNFFGTAAIGENTISFSGIGATRMACPDMRVEDALFQILSAPVTYSIAGRTMEWEQNGRVVVRMKALDDIGK